MTAILEILDQLRRANQEAIAAVAEIEASCPVLDRGALICLKDWLQEQRQLIVDGLRVLSEGAQ